MTDIHDTLRRALSERYTVEEQIGEGGMARVFRATDAKHERTVAIKVLRPELGVSLGSERFLAEIRICAGLTHPHILPLYDSGVAGDLLYYVMPFIEGESLRARLEREKQLPVEDALRIARGVAVALAHAHSRGIVHRDIKPENILLQSDEPIVADFGIAKAVSAAGVAGTTSAGIAVGTPAYMSPEQASAAEDIDGRSDVYSLGCVLYEMLVGEPPFSGPTPMAITARKLSEPVPHVRTVRDAVPPMLDALIEKALGRLPADRFASAWEFAQALAGSATSSMSMPRYEDAPAQPPPPNSIAVLPFRNLSADPEDEFLSDGIAEELIHALSKVQGMHVVARTSAFAFKGKQDDVRTIGQRLNVGVVLEGSLRRAGKRLRVTTSLINVANGFELWSERYDRTVDDAFAVQDEIAGATVEALKATMLGGAVAAPAAAAVPAANPRAYELYLRGRHAWSRRSRDALYQSVDYLESAIAEDKSFAKAHVALAEIYVTLALYGLRAPDDAMQRAEDSAERASDLAPDSGESFPAWGCVQAMYRWNWALAEESFKKAIEVNPSYPTARHWYAINCLAPQGRFEEARAELFAATTHDPLSSTIGVSQGIVAFFARQYGKALDEYRAVLHADPGFGMAHYFIGQVLEELGQAADAVASFTRAGGLVGRTPETMAGLARALAIGGDRRAAEALLAEMRAPADRYVSPASLAQVYLGLSDADQALDWLEKAAQVRATELAWIGVSPIYDPLREHPRFKALLATVGLGK